MANFLSACIAGILLMKSHDLFHRAGEAADVIAAAIAEPPKVAVVLGSGIGASPTG